MTEAVKVSKQPAAEISDDELAQITAALRDTRVPECRFRFSPLPGTKERAIYLTPTGDVTTRVAAERIREVLEEAFGTKYVVTLSKLPPLHKLP